MLHFCIPTFMLKKLNLPDTRLEAVCLIAETFNVSFQIANERLLRYENQLLSSYLQNSLSASCLVT